MHNPPEAIHFRVRGQPINPGNCAAIVAKLFSNNFAVYSDNSAINKSMTLLMGSMSHWTVL
jgi:hypothetical protein